MSDIIRLLPDHVANQIAAGEVVQRPASVVKELLENSVDAGAGADHLGVKDAGRTLIQVTDDGKGMSATDARTCFERHATSKIRLADDLQTVRTKGFRGEALASIAAIAQVELKTRQEGKDLGTRVLIEGSRVQAQEAIACPVGSSLHVRSLFYNVPARRQFLKSDPVEMKHVIEEFQRVALAHPGVRFRLLHNEQELFHLEPGNERQRIVGVFGRKFDERLVPVEEATEFVRVEGFVTKPEFAKRNRGEQYFFVNSRFIRSPYLEHAVRRAYEELIARDNYPGWFLFLELDPAWIDINIHPTKTEIKFRDDRTVYAIVHAAVRRALGRHNITPSIDFEPEPALLMGATATGPVRGEPPVSSGRWRPTDLPPQTSSAGWQQLFDLGSARVTQHDEMLPGFAPKEEEHPLPLHHGSHRQPARVPIAWALHAGAAQERLRGCGPATGHGADHVRAFHAVIGSRQRQQPGAIVPCHDGIERTGPCAFAGHFAGTPCLGIPVGTIERTQRGGERHAGGKRCRGPCGIAWPTAGTSPQRARIAEGRTPRHLGPWHGPQCNEPTRETVGHGGNA
jgi:DNA mismatch repair protein MutL